MRPGADVEVITEPPRCPFRACDPPADFAPVGSGWDFEYGTTLQDFTYARCPRCGVVVNTTLPVAQEMARIYPHDYYAFSDSKGGNALVTAVRNRLERAKVAEFRRLVGREAADIIDIGCGDGRLLDILAREAPAGWRYAGVEIGPEAAATAACKGYDVRPGDFDFLDLADWTSRFDLALMHQVIEHTRYPRETLDKVHALLRPGGILSIETPDLDAWDRRLFGDRYWGGWHIPRHFFMFDKKSLPALAEATGFEVVSMRSILSPVFWIHSIHNMVADSRPLQRFAPMIRATNPVLLAVATSIELVQTKLFGSSSNLQIILRKTRDTPA
jgi:SAM-dependent methyltransferase